MKLAKRNPLVSAALAATTLALASGCATTDGAGGDLEGEARLAEMIQGKTAGEAQSCIPATISSRLTIIDETAVVYDAGDTIYVARPDNPESLDDSDVLVIERTGGQLCKQDIVRTIDRTQGYPTGAVFLGDWIPYR